MNILCTCCKSELTAPQWHNGYPYGYKCIEKVAPKAKKSRRVFVACEFFKVSQIPGTTLHVVKATVKGDTIVVKIYGNPLESKYINDVYYQNGIMYIDDSLLK